MRPRRWASSCREPNDPDTWIATDASGVGALNRFLKRCQHHGTAVFLAEIQPRAREVFAGMGVLAFSNVTEVGSYAEALAQAGAWVNREPAKTLAQA